MFGEWEEDDPVVTEEKKEKSLKRQKELMEEMLELQKKIEKTSVKSLEHELKIAKLNGDSFGAKEKELKLLEKLNDLNELRKTKASELSEAEKASLNDQQKAIEDIMAKLNISNENIKERIQQLNKETSGMFSKGAEAGQDFFGGIASKLGLSSKAGGNWIAKAREMITSMKDPQFRGDFVQKMKDIFTIENLSAAAAAAVAQATIAMALAADKATAAFAKATGTGGTFKKRITELGSSYQNLGITQEDAAKAIGSLYDKMPGYTSMTRAQQAEVEKLTATMEKLGVATDDTATLMSDLMKSQKMSAEQAKQQTIELGLMAQALQMRSGEFVKGFIEARKTLAVYGRDAKKIFRDLAAQARATGTEVSTLLGIASKFDTFSESAETAGKLNAILGAQFSAMDLLNQTEEKRIETLIRGMQQQGVAFKDMDRFTQKAIMATIGLTDLNEAQKILGMDLSSYKKMQKESAAAAKKQEEMDKKAKEAMDTMQKLKMAFASLATAILPVVEWMQWGAQQLLELSHATKGWSGKVLMAAIALTALYKIMMPLKTLWLITLGIGRAFNFMLGARIGLTKLQTALTGTWIATLWGKVTALWAATTAQGANTAATINDSVTKPAHIALLTAQAAAATASATALWAAAAAMLAAGVGVALMIGSVALLVYMFVLLGENALAAGAGIALMAVGVLLLAGAMVVMATIGWAGVAVVLVLTAAMAGLAYSIGYAGEKTAEAFGEINKFISDSNFKDIITALDGLGAAFVRLNNALAGGGIIGKAAGFLGLGMFVPKKKSPIKQLVDDLQPLIKNASSLAPIFKGMSDLVSIMDKDIKSPFDGLSDSITALSGASFDDLAAGLNKIYVVVDDTTDAGAQITHTLENLALISSGRSARTNAAAEIGKALKSLKTEFEVTVQLNPEATERFLEGRAIKAMGKLY